MLVVSWFWLKVRRFLSHFLLDFFHPPFKTAHLLPKLVRGSLISLKLSHAPSSCFTFSALRELGELLREGERGVIHNKTYSHTAGQKESANNALTLIHRNCPNAPWMSVGMSAIITQISSGLRYTAEASFWRQTAQVYTHKTWTFNWNIPYSARPNINVIILKVKSTQ